jgi:DNA adenine methylase
MSQLRSPLRYPGGKSRAIEQILPLIPANIKEYREPFIGGGSVFVAVKKLFKRNIERYWINDLNYDLISFWRLVRADIDWLVRGVNAFRERYPDGRELYEFLKKDENLHSEQDRAVRFFIMNRITFSGVMDAGGYSQQAFEKRFTLSSIERLKDISTLLSQDVEITNTDYEELLQGSEENVFIFLDPPYYSATESRLYGVRGELHTSFDHARFAENMRNCRHRWLITYDDSPKIRELFRFANLTEWELQYGMNNFMQGKADKGKELFIKNY